tara:strand:- start:154 stop:795 length:642 start_codon:yes stop_codon:yes gene_type:complete
MKVLVACEYSGIVRDAFINKGHEAVSCDLLPSESDLGEHYQGDVTDILYDGWDLMIAHPPCTYLSVSGARWYYHPEDKHLPYDERRPHPMHPNRRQYQQEALDFVQLLLDAPIEKIVVENPISVISSKIKKPTQIIQPYEYGHPTSKSTCLWLKNLEPLQPTDVVEPIWINVSKGKRMSKFHYDTYTLPKEERGKIRSATFPGIAKAMANQWG